MRILGIDPGLQRTGWGVIRTEGSALSFIACGTLKSDSGQPLATRLRQLHGALSEVLRLHTPQAIAVEETFVNVSGASTLKLGQARGALLLTAALSGVPVYEYAATLVKKSVVGAGRAEKAQVAMMVKTLLPRADIAGAGADATDALAIAICHASHASLRSAVKAGV